METKQYSWKFPFVFWVANAVELLERASYYGMFIVLTVYLTNLVGFTDVEAGWVAGVFAALIYLLPPFAGAASDLIGFRKALILAFTLLALGYSLLGFLHTKVSSVTALVLIATGGAFIKPIITGTVAKTSDETNRARAFSIFYQMVNIGAFTGKALAKPIRTEMGIEYVNFLSATLCFVAVLVVLFFYKKVDAAGVGKGVSETLRGFVRVCTNVRFISLILIVAGFWAIQHQMYATMPKYVFRMVGEHAAPEWYANVNPLVVVVCVIPVTHLVRKLSPVNSISIAMLMIPFSALIMGVSPYLEAVFGKSIGIALGLTLHPITVAFIAGIAMQGFAECFLSPRFLEFASKQAPPDEVGLYMGYSHLTSFFANLLGFGISGYLLDMWCPDPKTLQPEVYAAWQNALTSGAEMPGRYAHAHYIWYVFAGIGFAAFLAIQVFRIATRKGHS